MSSSTISPSRSRPSTRSCALMIICVDTGSRSILPGVAEPVVRSRSNFATDNHRLEIYWGIDQIGSDGHVRAPSEWKGARSLEDAIADPVQGQDTTLHDPALLKG